jgi:hypothetical protein
VRFACAERRDLAAPCMREVGASVLEVLLLNLGSCAASS